MKSDVYQQKLYYHRYRPSHSYLMYTCKLNVLILIIQMSAKYIIIITDLMGARKLSCIYWPTISDSDYIIINIIITYILAEVITMWPPFI